MPISVDQLAGRKALISLQPAYAPTAAIDRSNIAAFLASCRTAGVSADVILWPNPFAAGLTSAQYLAMVAYYGPTVRGYFPLAYHSLAGQGAGGSAATFASFYPGDGACDKVLATFTAAAYEAGVTLDAYAAVADGATPPKPFGIAELEANLTTDSQANVTAFFGYAGSFMAGRLNAGRSNADVLWYNESATATSTWSPVTSGSYAAGLYQGLAAQLSGASAARSAGEAATPAADAAKVGIGDTTTTASRRKWPSGATSATLGAYTALPGIITPEAATELREAALGRHYALGLTYADWLGAFPASGEAGFAAYGRTPVLTWYGPGKTANDGLGSLADINSGSYDALIRAQCAALAAFRAPVVVILMPSMAGGTYPGWGAQPAAYTAAWRRIWSAGATAGAGNVSWCWCPDAAGPGPAGCYPGDPWVDMIGALGFNDTTVAPWADASAIFGPFLSAWAPRGKPQMVITATSAASGSADTWIADARSWLKASGPSLNVAGLCYLDTTDPVTGTDWRTDQSAASFAAWKALAADPYFGG